MARSVEKRPVDSKWPGEGRLRLTGRAALSSGAKWRHDEWSRRASYGPVMAGTGLSVRLGLIREAARGRVSSARKRTPPLTPSRGGLEGNVTRGTGGDR